MRRSLLGIALALASVASACSTGANALEGQGALPPLQIAGRNLTMIPVVDPAISLESAGAEPHELLQLAPAVGTRQTIEITQSGSQELAVGDESGSFLFPTVSVTATLTVTGTSDGAATTAISIDKADSATDVDPAMRQQSETLVQAMRGASATITTAANGQIVGNEPVIGDGDASESLVLGYLDRTIFSLADPLPTAPIGIGARWSLSTEAITAGVPAVIARTYEITSITETEVRASVHRTVTFETGPHLETTVMAGSQLDGRGEVIWPRGGVIGVASYGLSGVLSYGLDDNASLEQHISRSITSTIAELSIPVIVTTTTTAAPQAPVDDDGGADDGGGEDDRGEDEEAAPDVADVAAPDVAAPDVAAPSVPSGLKITVTTDAISLVWAESTDDTGVDRYLVYRTEGTPDSSEAILIAEPSLTSYVDPVTESGTYYYFIKAIDAAGNTSWRTGAKQAVRP